GDARSAAATVLVPALGDRKGGEEGTSLNLGVGRIIKKNTGNGANGNSSTANFLSGFIKSLPPLQELASMAGVELPEYLGKLGQDREIPAPSSKPAVPRGRGGDGSGSGPSEHPSA
ncbi:MAG: hypothetical protein KC729_20755, partial [Candidatus Eisenbacteria bacterium]|nr:hypothetical protein [Candidatus Eisenbacteria bacterium]